MERVREGLAILLNDVWDSTVIDFYGLISGLHGLKFVWWWCTALMKEMVKKGRGSGKTWTGL